LKRNRDLFSLSTPKGLSKMRAEGTNRNVVQEYFDFVKKIPEELGTEKNPENFSPGIKLDFRRTTALKSRCSKRKKIQRSRKGSRCGTWRERDSCWLVQ
jgi:hypothetical protein